MDVFIKISWHCVMVINNRWNWLDWTGLPKNARSPGFLGHLPICGVLQYLHTCIAAYRYIRLGVMKVLGNSANGGIPGRTGAPPSPLSRGAGLERASSQTSEAPFLPLSQVPRRSSSQQLTKHTLVNFPLPPVTRQYTSNSYQWV